jgi:hypothetical protein
LPGVLGVLAFFCLLWLPLRTPAFASQTPAAAAEERIYWIYLKERPRGPEEGPLRVSPALTERARARHARVGWQLQDGDLPVHGEWVAQLERCGVRPRVCSRWLHAISAPLGANLLSRVAALPFVREVRPVRCFRAALPESFRVLRHSQWQEREFRSAPQPFPAGARSSLISGLPEEYGESFGQLAMLGVPDLHARGLSGEGVLIALLDAGYHKEHPAFDSLDITAEWDFVDDDGQTQNWDPETETGWGDFHGTFTLSALAGFLPGELIGPAYRASFLLGRTEEVEAEFRGEEDFYVAGLEWAEALGADIISTSLGYRHFGDGFSYPADSLDGKTAVTTVGVNEAARRGVLVVTSVGNEGPEAISLGTPADSDLCIAVGALMPWRQIADFSSRGPTADGRTKPDLCAQGSEVICGRWLGFFTDVGSASGTSLAAPLVAGVAALLMEAQQGRSGLDLLQELREIGDRSADPDNDYGYGMPWAPLALDESVGTVVVDSLAWSEPPRRDLAPLLQIRLTNRGGGSSLAGTVTPRGAAGGAQCAGEPQAVPILAPGESVWIGTWEVDLHEIASVDVWAGIVIELELGEDLHYRWIAFEVAPSEPVAPLSLMRVWPQPWVGGAVLALEYSHPSGGGARLEMFDATGRLAVRLSDGIQLQAGQATLEIDPTQAQRLHSGYYILRLRSDAGDLVCPMIRIR